MQPATNTCVKDHQFFPYCLLKTVPCILKKIKGTVSLLRWGNTSCFFPILRPVLEAPTVLFLVPNDEGPKEGDPISKYCSRPKVLGTFGCDLQCCDQFPHSSREADVGVSLSFSSFYGGKLDICSILSSETLFWRHLQNKKLQSLGFSPWALLQRKSCSSRTFPDEMLS